MSSITASINGTNANYTINVETMRQRLETLQTRLQAELQQSGGTNAKLADRLDKVNSQIERLERLAGTSPNISANRGLTELGRGMRLLNEGINYMTKNNMMDQGGHRLENWRDHLLTQQKRLDKMA